MSGVPNPFLARNTSPYPFSRPHRPCVISIWTGLTCFLYCLSFTRMFSLGFPNLPVFNRLGGDSIFLCILSLISRCFLVEFLPRFTANCDFSPLFHDMIAHELWQCARTVVAGWEDGHRKVVTLFCLIFFVFFTFSRCFRVEFSPWIHC